MVEGRVQRKLAAILAADVVAYSRMMSEDEAGTLARVKARTAKATAMARIEKTMSLSLLINGSPFSLSKHFNNVVCFTLPNKHSVSIQWNSSSFLRREYRESPPSRCAYA